MMNFSDIHEHQDLLESIQKNYFKCYTVYHSVEDPLSMHHKTASNDIPYIINNENIIIILGQGKKLVSILSDEFCEEQIFPYLLTKGKFGYKAPHDFSISPAWYCNQRLFCIRCRVYIFLTSLYMSDVTYIHR